MKKPFEKGGGPPMGAETLAELTARLRKSLRAAAGREIDLALELVGVRDTWEATWQKQDPEKRTFAQWYDAEFKHRHFSYYERTAAAVQAVGRDVAVMLTREALLRLCRLAKTGADVRGLTPEISRKYRECGSQRLSGGQLAGCAKPIYTSRKRGPSWAERYRMLADELVRVKERVGRLETQIRAGCAKGTKPVE